MWRILQASVCGVCIHACAGMQMHAGNFGWLYQGKVQGDRERLTNKTFLEVKASFSLGPICVPGT